MMGADASPVLWITPVSHQTYQVPAKNSLPITEVADVRKLHSTVLQKKEREENNYRRRWESFSGVDAFQLVAIEDVEEAGHAAHVLVNVFFQVLVVYHSRRHVFHFPFLVSLGFPTI